MSVNLPTFYVEQFSTNVDLLLQQKGSRLRDCVMSGTYVGSQASPVDQIAPVAAKQVTTRFAPMGRVDANLDRRWVFPADYDLPQLIDTFDKLRLIVDPESQYVTNAVYALGRKMDDAILSAFTATAFHGVQGTSTISPLAGNTVSVNTGGTTSGLNVAKLRAAKKILMGWDVAPEDPIYCAVTAQEHDALLNEIQVINSDYSGKYVMEDGLVTRFLGINFVHTERVQSGTDDQSGTSNAIPIWAKSGMHMGIWGDTRADISQRKDLQGLPWQAYCYATFGATRIEEKKIVNVWCRGSDGVGLVG
jgi:hypothetical protein